MTENSVSKSAWYCCGVRMDDARSASPLVGDRFAERFMDDAAMSMYAPMRAERMATLSNIMRCKLTDEAVASALAADRATRVVSLGAGFDSRPYRMSGGRWTEIDEPDLLARKEALLPAAECANPLLRVPVRFSRGELAAALPEPDGAPVLVVIEGVTMYLPDAAIASSLAALTARYPRHTVVCDLMDRAFQRRFAKGISARLAAAGTAFSERPTDPAAVFRDAGYRLVERQPMFAASARRGLLRQHVGVPWLVAEIARHTVIRGVNGNAVHRFVFGG